MRRKAVGTAPAPEEQRSVETGEDWRRRDVRRQPFGANLPDLRKHSDATDRDEQPC